MVFIKKPYNSMRKPILPGTCVAISGTSSCTATLATCTIILEIVTFKHKNKPRSQAVKITNTY